MGRCEFGFDTSRDVCVVNMAKEALLEQVHQWCQNGIAKVIFRLAIVSKSKKKEGRVSAQSQVKIIKLNSLQINWLKWENDNAVFGTKCGTKIAIFWHQQMAMSGLGFCQKICQIMAIARQIALGALALSRFILVIGGSCIRACNMRLGVGIVW